MKIRKDTWNTYRTSCYTHDVANDQQSAGGVHHHQVRLHKGRWEKRIVQSNGRFTAVGPTETVDDESGASWFELAKAR